MLLRTNYIRNVVFNCLKNENMDLEPLKLFIEILSSLALIISIIYLAKQVKQGTKSLQTSMRDSSFHSLLEWNYHIFSDSELAWIFQKGAKDFNSLDEIQKPRMIHMIYSFIKVFENIYLHHLDKSVESNVWENNYKVFALYFMKPGLQFYWKERREIFDPRFISYVETEHDSQMESAQSIIDNINTD